MIQEKFMYSKEVEIGITPGEVGIQFANGNSGQQAAFLDAVAATWDQWKPIARDSQIEAIVHTLSSRALSMLDCVCSFVNERKELRKELDLDSQ